MVQGFSVVAWKWKYLLVMPVRMLMMEKEIAELVKRLKSRFSSCL